MKSYWIPYGLPLVIAGSTAITLFGCGSRDATAPDQPPEPVPSIQTASPDTGTEPAIDAPVEANVEIDIGDVTYGVYANIEIPEASVQQNVHVERLASPRFDQRTQLLTVNIFPPHPDSLPMLMLVGSTRFLMGHTVYLEVHTFREYTNAAGEKVNEEILTFDRILGDDRFKYEPDVVPFDAFAGMSELPETMLLYAELEAWLFLNTAVETFDPETADFDAPEIEHKRYQGFNPARINLLEWESEE